MIDPLLTWNSEVRMILADVDETIADIYSPAEPAMITALSSLLQDGCKLFMVTGGSLARVRRDITDCIDPLLRCDILISHCSGAEVWGFTADGELRDQPFYSVYEETFTVEMKADWRAIIAQVVDEFSLRIHRAQPTVPFARSVDYRPLDIILDDRGPQITMEVVNGIDLTSEQLDALPYEVPLTHGKYDLRTPIKHRAQELLAGANIPITPRFGGNFALDFAVEGISKTTSIQAVLQSPEILNTIELEISDVQNPVELEIWGDKFSVLHGGTDRHMSEAVSPEVRSIDFRQEDPSEFLEGYNTVVWNGQQQLHGGLLEYLQSRHVI